MKPISIVAYAVALVFSLSAVLLTDAKAGERNGFYIAVPSGFANNPARAVTLANSRFYNPNPYRKYMGPNYRARYFRSYRYYYRYPVRRKYRGRGWRRR